MPRSLRVYIAGVVTLSAIALVVATLLFPRGSANRPTMSPVVPGSRAYLSSPRSFRSSLGIVFWTVLTLVASALPVRLPLGSHQAVAMAPIVAAMALGGPAVGGWVAAIGTTEIREVRGRIPWYGSLANHAGVDASGHRRWRRPGCISEGRVSRTASGGLASNFVATMLGAASFLVLNRDR